MSIGVMCFKVNQIKDIETYNASKIEKKSAVFFPKSGYRIKNEKGTYFFPG